VAQCRDCSPALRERGDGQKPPASRLREAWRGRPYEPPASGATEGPEMISTRILLVEDDPYVRDACVQILEDHTVVAVDDGVLALEEIERRRPDVILLDLIMPRARLDGLALLSQLAARPRVRIIVPYRVRD